MPVAKLVPAAGPGPRFGALQAPGIGGNSLSINGFDSSFGTSSWRRISCASRITQGDRWPRPVWPWRWPAARTTAASPARSTPRAPPPTWPPRRTPSRPGPPPASRPSAADISLALSGSPLVASSAALALSRPSQGERTVRAPDRRARLPAAAPASRPASSAIPVEVAREDLRLGREHRYLRRLGPERRAVERRPLPALRGGSGDVPPGRAGRGDRATST